MIASFGDVEGKLISKTFEEKYRNIKIKPSIKLQLEKFYSDVSPLIHKKFSSLIVLHILNLTQYALDLYSQPPSDWEYQ